MTDYMNIREAAEKWGLTVRRVQDLCKSGSVVGATRFGRAWMIPIDTARPADGRTKQMREIRSKVYGAFMLPVPRKNPFLIHTDIYNTPGTSQEVISFFDGYPETQRIVKAQFDYQRGNVDKIFEESNHFLDNHSGFYSTISAGMLLAFCAMWRGDIHLWRKARQHIYSAPCEGESDRKTVDFWIAVADSAVHDTRDVPEWFRNGDFGYLSADSYCVARVLYVKCMYISAHELASGKIKMPDVEGLGLMRSLPFVIEPMISQARVERTLIPESYLHLMAAVVYHNLGDDTKAASHIDAAIALCLPDKLYGTLVEYRSPLDNLLDERLGAIDPAALTQVRALHKKMRAGQVKLHNLLLERNISTALTVREREVARLAAFGLSNGEIAARLHIEVSSVKQYIFSAMNKVGAAKRTELGLYI